MRIAIGCDHRGLELKAEIMKLLAADGHTCRDFGGYTETAVDYPDIAVPVAEAVVSPDYDYGILICFTGIGMSIAANKYPGIQAGLCRDAFDAGMTRRHNNANILCLAAGREYESLPEILEKFLGTAFEAGRHARRLEKVRAIGQRRAEED
jgi:ribose 5-phosphate isomerase B